MRLIDLDPQLLVRISPLEYEMTDDVACAHALALRCPACYWAGRRTGIHGAHAIIVWGDAERWRFVGSDYKNLSMLAGRTPVDVTAGACHAAFRIKRGKVDFI